MIALLPVGAEKRPDENLAEGIDQAKADRVWQKGPSQLGPSAKSWFQLCNAGGTVVRCW